MFVVRWFHSNIRIGVVGCLDLVNILSGMKCHLIYFVAQTEKYGNISTIFGSKVHHVLRRAQRDRDHHPLPPIYF